MSLPELDETIEDIRSLIRHRSAVEDSIATEIYSASPTHLISRQLLPLFIEMWKTKKCPKYKKTSVIIPIYKKKE